MDPQPTVVQAPLQLRIADDIRMQIELGKLRPGDPLPTLAELCQRWSCSMSSARGAIALLKAQGLITSGRGKPPTVRIAPGKVIRSSERHQVEKDLAIRPEAERATIGEAETNLNMSIRQQRFESHYDQVSAGDELARIFAIQPNDLVLRRRFEAADKDTGLRLSWSVAYIPLDLVKGNPALLDERNEPWPGGTMNQLATVGIEIARIVDEVTARMPTTPEMHLWGLPDGVPIIFCRRISFDTIDRAVEVSDADYPADRTELQFVTPLRPWPKSHPNLRSISAHQGDEIPSVRVAQ